jgi:peroxiredoxin
MLETLLSPGEPAPWFTAASTSNPKYRFETVAGRSIVLCFFQSAGTSVGQQVLQDLWKYSNPIWIAIGSQGNG